MNEDAKNFRLNLLSEIRAEAQTGGDYQKITFADRACQILVEAEEFTDYGLCRAHAPWRNTMVQADAYSLSEGDGVLSLMVVDFSGDDDPEPVSTDEVKKLVQAAFRLLDGSTHGDVANCWDVSHPAHNLSKGIYDFASASESMTKAVIYYISDRELGAQLGKMPDLSLGTQRVEIQLWDIARLARADMSVSGREKIVIDFAHQYDERIPVLVAGLGDDAAYQSYMCIMPGDILAGLYDRFGGRILEQNVRAFLGEGRKVNKGIRETLRDAPSMFFAFNNGLTATAAEIRLEPTPDGGQVMASVTDFQIVNGGQTTASLFWARKAGYDLSHVHVQMKLSVLPEEHFEESVHNIARYANAQNAVSAADLFAGHPYFKRIETLAGVTLAPAVKQGEPGSYWFFERTQGSYNVEIRRRKGAAAKTWEFLHPKKQRLTKTDVARYEGTWNVVPHSVCAGAQKNVAAFAKIISARWNTNPELFGPVYFNHLVAKTILTKAVDAAIPAQAWYPKSMLRQLTTYTLSLMADRMADKGLEPDFDAVWRRQNAPEEFLQEAMRVAKAVMPYLMDIPEEQVRNRLVTEWAKREACWIRLKESDISLSPEYLSRLRRTETAHAPAQRWPAKAMELWRNGSWRRLHEWNKASNVLSEGERELVERAAITNSFNFRGFKLTKLKESWATAVRNGFV